MTVRRPRRLLVPVLREATLIEGDVLLEGAPRLLAVLEALLRVLDGLSGVAETRLGVGKTLRVRGDRPPRILDGGVELLKLDEPFEIRRH